MVPKDYDATKRAQREFYGDKAKDHTGSRFKQAELISPKASFQNPSHGPAKTSVNNLDTINENDRRGRGARANTKYEKIKPVAQWN